MKFSIFTMPEHYVGENLPLAYDRDIQKIVTAERLGFDEFLIGEHHTELQEPVPVPEYYIAKASALTHRIKLGTLVVQVPFHDPFQVAERLAFLDQLTHGRLIAGLSTSTLQSDNELFEVPREDGKPMTLEGIEVIDSYMHDRTPKCYQGKYYSYNNERKIAVGPYKNRRIPIAVPGFTSYDFFRLAAQNGYMSFSSTTTPMLTEGDLPSLKKQGLVLDEESEKAGNDPAVTRQNWRIAREVYVAETTEQALEDVGKIAQESYEYYKRLGLTPFLKLSPDMSDDDVTADFLRENSPWLIGSPENVIEKIELMKEHIGDFGGIMCQLRPWTSDHKWNNSMELLARKVMPRFQ